MSEVEATACPKCRHKALRIEWRYEATPSGQELRFSLAGRALKLPVRGWPWLVCGHCGVEARAKDAAPEPEHLRGLLWSWSCQHCAAGETDIAARAVALGRARAHVAAEHGADVEWEFRIFGVKPRPKKSHP